jgi:hypothetical protein
VEAGEGHGPRKEFFALAGQDMAGAGPAAAARALGLDAAAPPPSSEPEPTALRPALWVFNRTAGYFWYNTSLAESEELRAAYAFAGWLLGQGLYNRSPLGLRLPPVLFQAVLDSPAGGGRGFAPSLELLASFDPDAAAAVRNVASLPPEQLAGMLEMEGLPRGMSAQVRPGGLAGATALCAGAEDEQPGWSVRLGGGGHLWRGGQQRVRHD